MAKGDLAGYTRGSDGFYRKIERYREEVTELRRDEKGRLVGIWHLWRGRRGGLYCREIMRIT